MFFKACVVLHSIQLTYAYLHRMSNSFIKTGKGVFKDFGRKSPYKITIVMKYTVLFTQTNFYKNKKDLGIVINTFSNFFYLIHI